MVVIILFPEKDNEFYNSQNDLICKFTNLKDIFKRLFQIEYKIIVLFFN